MYLPENRWESLGTADSMRFWGPGSRLNLADSVRWGSGREATFTPLAGDGGYTAFDEHSIVASWQDVIGCCNGGDGCSRGTDRSAESARHRRLADICQSSGMECEIPTQMATTELPSMRRPDEPNAFLFLSNASGDQTIMIERLADKPDGKAADAWLHEVAKDSVLSPIRREEWITLSGSKALKVVNDGSEKHEPIEQAAISRILESLAPVA